jgi:valyl-tRNA synthetase
MGMTKELPKSFSPNQVEEEIYNLWEESDAFKPKPLIEDGNYFSIIMPPPNANGSLHIGHAVGVTLQDIMTRYHRMLGDSTLWLPGADHAGFETQVVYAKKLEKEGRNWFAIDRHDLYREIKKFTLDQKIGMVNQLKRLGASADWSRERFTLDPKIIDIVYNTFIKLHEDGLAYRGSRIVNWCSKHQTSLSDLETKYEEREDPFYYLKFGPFVIGTARPETKFGDKYIVVNPHDKRYSQYQHNQKITVDWINGPIEATIIKDESIDPEFGTGAMTITPYHSEADFEIAQKYNLDIVQVIDKFGKLLPISGEFEGLKINAARPLIIEKFKKLGLLLEDKTDLHYKHKVELCYKCNTVIEPQVSPQWFIAMTKKIANTNSTHKGYSLQDLGLETIKSGESKFVTPHFQKVYSNWLNNLRDWNISRQIVWGIQLPVWYCQCGEVIVDQPKNGKLTFMRHGQAEHNILHIGNGDPTKPYNLTELGHQQVKEAASHLKKKNCQFDLIVSSQMPRVKETAEILKNEFQAEIVIDERLNDINLAGLEGKKMTEIHNLTDYHQNSVEGSETFAQVVERLQSFIKDYYKKDYSNVLVVTSEIVFTSLKYILGEKMGENHEETVTNAADKTISLSDFNICPKCHNLTANRDQDVFDTWFSSGQWPFATLQSSSNPTDFDNFYPTSVMETGYDIIFFWVSRMIMLGKYMTGKSPFKDIYFNGLVRDQDRKKMSKSKGNVIDPLGVASIYGVDAVRMALVFGTSAGSDIVISEDKIKGMRNFANKVWNIGRFIIATLEEAKFEKMDQTVKPESAADKLIIEKLNQTNEIVKKNIETFHFHEAAQKIYDFLWHDLADTYLEESKNQLKTDQLKTTLVILNLILIDSLKLLHPFMPYVSEAIWQELFERKLVSEKLLITSSFPETR